MVKMVFKNWLKNIQAAGYNGPRTVNKCDIRVNNNVTSEMILSRCRMHFFVGWAHNLITYLQFGNSTMHVQDFIGSYYHFDD